MSNQRVRILDGSHLVEEGRARLERAFQWNQRWHESANGFPFEEDLSGPEGMHFTIFVPEDFEGADLQEAIDDFLQDRDATGFTVYALPKSFFEEMEWSFE